MYDLIVIGGGPAGTAAAITAARSGARVLLLERGRLPRHKVCGEFVSAESLELLASLLAGNPDALSMLQQAPRIGRGRLFIDGSVLEAPVDPPAASVARLELDAALWRAAEQACVDARQQEMARDISGTGPFVVSTSGGKFEARSVINASGRWSNLKSAGDGNGANPRWLGVKAHFAEHEPAASVDLYFFDGGYCGVQPVDIRGGNHNGGRINACAMVRADVASSLPDVFRCHPRLSERSQRWEPLSEPVATSPLIFGTPQPEKSGVLLAGDGAGFVDPFVGDGISLALRSGNLAAESLRPFFEGKISLTDAVQDYRETYTRHLLPVFRASSKIRRLFALPAPVRAGLLLFFEGAPAVTRYLVRRTR